VHSIRSIRDRTSSPLRCDGTSRRVVLITKASLLNFANAPLYRALSRAGEGGLSYDELTYHAERALDLPASAYADEPILTLN
jgi:hypothetical protein